VHTINPVLQFDPNKRTTKYKHLKCIGKINYSIPYGKEDVKFTAVKGPIHDWMKNQKWYNRVKQLATFRVVKTRRNNVEKSYAKQDRPMKKPAADDPKWLLAQKYVEMYVHDKLKADIGLDENTRIKLDTSPGPSWEKMGCKPKFEAMMHASFVEIAAKYHTPVWKNAAKREFLSLQEILEDKIRTFKIADVDFLIVQKMLYEKLSERFKEASKDPKFWVRYGFSKEYGGFNQMINRLKRAFYIWSLDVSGWDKSISCMEEWYKIKERCIPFHPLKEYVRKNTINSLEADGDGFVVENEGGNRSGSGDTTTDNCGCHLLVMTYLLISIYHMKHGKMPTYTEVYEQLVNLLGDDNLSGVFEDFCIEGKMADIIRSVYAEFGLLVKEKAFKEQYMKPGDEILDFEFLGSTAKYNKELNTYVPIPRVEKICSSIIYSDGHLSIDIYTQRIIGLIYLCYGIDWLDELLFEILGYLVENYHNVLPDFVPYLRSELLLLRQTGYARMAGYESSECYDFYTRGGRGGVKIPAHAIQTTISR